MFDVFFFVKQKTAYEMRISDWSSDVCSSDLEAGEADGNAAQYDDPEQDLLAGIEFLRRGMDAPAEHAAALGQPDEIVPVRQIVPDPDIGRASCRERVCKSV